MVSGCATQTFSSCSSTGRDIYILNGDEASCSLVFYSSFFFSFERKRVTKWMCRRGREKKNINSITRLKPSKETAARIQYICSLLAKRTVPSFSYFLSSLLGKGRREDFYGRNMT